MYENPRAVAPNPKLYLPRTSMYCGRTAGVRGEGFSIPRLYPTSVYNILCIEYRH